MSIEKYKTFTQRFVAILIDLLLVLPIGFIDEWIKQNNPPTVILYIWIIISSFVFSAYFVIMHGLYGQTLGKMAMRVKVLHISENPITFRQSVWRESPNILFNLCLIFSPALPILTNQTGNFDFLTNPIGNTIYILILVWGISDIIPVFFNDKSRAIHDYIAGTVVVKTNL